MACAVSLIDLFGHHAPKHHFISLTDLFTDFSLNFSFHSIYFAIHDRLSSVEISSQCLHTTDISISTSTGLISTPVTVPVIAARIDSTAELTTGSNPSITLRADRLIERFLAHLLPSGSVKTRGVPNHPHTVMLQLFDALSVESIRQNQRAISQRQLTIRQYLLKCGAIFLRVLHN